MKAASVTEPNCPGASDWLLPLTHTHFSTGWRHSAVISVFPVLGPTHTHTGAVESHSVGRPSASHTHVCDRTRWHSDIPLPPQKMSECWVGGANATRAEVRNPYKGRCSAEQRKKGGETPVLHTAHISQMCCPKNSEAYWAAQRQQCALDTHTYTYSRNQAWLLY